MKIALIMAAAITSVTLQPGLPTTTKEKTYPTASAPQHPQSFADTIIDNQHKSMASCFYGGMMVQENLSDGSDKNPKVRAAMIKMAKSCYSDKFP